MSLKEADKRLQLVFLLENEYFLSIFSDEMRTDIEYLVVGIVGAE